MQITVIETSNEYKLNNESFLFFLAVVYKNSHAGTLVTNMTSATLSSLLTRFGLKPLFEQSLIIFGSPINTTLESAHEWVFPLSYSLQYEVDFCLWPREFPGQSNSGFLLYH